MQKAQGIVLYSLNLTNSKQCVLYLNFVAVSWSTKDYNNLVKLSIML